MKQNVFCMSIYVDQIDCLITHWCVELIQLFHGTVPKARAKL